VQIHVIKHTAFEGPGSIATWAKERGYRMETTEVAQGQALPSPRDFDALVLMGGPMSVNDEEKHPWLRPEKALVRETLGLGRKVLGVCLGAQMIASALGAKVRTNTLEEIGWFPIEATAAGQKHPFFKRMPPVLMAFHWHGETFDLPSGAVHLARSAACEHQAYALGTQALALQCHMEVDAASLRDMTHGLTDELKPGRPFVQNETVLSGQPELLGPMARALHAVLDDWIAA
jgi:GMP synthase-like glutamine amidotransferase